jgi:hypothetical protein
MLQEWAGLAQDQVEAFDEGRKIDNPVDVDFDKFRTVTGGVTWLCTEYNPAADPMIFRDFQEIVEAAHGKGKLPAPKLVDRTFERTFLVYQRLWAIVEARSQPAAVQGPGGDDPFFPSSAFPTSVTSARLAHAAKDENIRRNKVGKRWHYSWNDTHRVWPQLVPTDPPKP